MTEHATLVLVRHGETEGNSSIRYHGITDVKLSETGRAQMRAARRELERRLPGGPAPIFTSPMSRAIESARLLTNERCPLIEIEQFREINFGLFEGLTAEEIHERYPDEHQRWTRQHRSPDFTFPGGDNRRAFTARVERGLDRMLSLCDEHHGAAGSYALLVAHRGVIHTIVRRLIGADIIVELGSIQILQRGSGWRAVHLDLIDHLRCP